MKGDIYGLTFTMVAAIVVAVCLAGAVFVVISSLHRSEVETLYSLQDLQEVDMSHFLEHCLKDGTDAVQASFVGDLAEAGNVQQACGGPFKMGFELEDLQVEENKWELDYGTYPAKSDPLIVSIKIGDEIHAGKLYVSFER